MIWVEWIDTTHSTEISTNDQTSIVSSSREQLESLYFVCRLYIYCIRDLSWLGVTLHYTYIIRSKYILDIIVLEYSPCHIFLSRLDFERQSDMFSLLLCFAYYTIVTFIPLSLATIS